jgi:hypothetical protein
MHQTYEGCIDLCISLLRQRKKKHLDEYLLRAACRLTSFGQVRFKLHGEHSADADLLTLHDDDLVRLDGNEIHPIFQGRHEELDFGEGAEVADITESDDDDRARGRRIK